MSLLNHSSAVGRRLQRLVGRRYAPGDKPLSSAAVGRRVAPANAALTGAEGVRVEGIVMQRKD